MATIQTTPNSDSQLFLRASPRGTRAGFSVLPDGAGGALTVTVLPKPWARDSGALREVAHTAGSTSHIVTYETEFVSVRADPAVRGAFASEVTALASEQADLLAVAGPPSKTVIADDITGDPFHDLIDLMLLADKGTIDGRRTAFEGALASSFLRLLRQERLLEVVGKLLFRARPRYAEQTEALRTPRGRLSEGSLLLSMATGVPTVESTFDELTMDTPILQVIASALRAVASDRLPRQIVKLRPSVPSRAVQLLRYFDGVTLIDRERAILQAERLWLGPLDRAWQPALDAALPVLQEHGIVPHTAEASTVAFAVHVHMEKFWEQCLEMVLRAGFSSLAVSRDAAPGEGVSVPAPWGVPMDPDDASDPTTKRFPDFMFQTGRRVVLADAKYKLHRGSAPSSQDGYQLFAYSHLATLGGRASDVAVILYPGRAGQEGRQVELVRMKHQDHPLWLATVPFPSRQDVQSQAMWSAYVARASVMVRDLSSAWVARAVEAEAIA